MKSFFIHPIYEITITLLLVGYLFWNISMILYVGNITAIIPGSIQLLTLLLMLFRSSLLQKSIKAWSVIFIVTALAKIFYKSLLHLSRDSDSIALMSNGFMLAIGVLLWYIAEKKIELRPKIKKSI